jgi:hypothetical protein
LAANHEIISHTLNKENNQMSIKYKLYSDNRVWHHEYPANETIVSIMADQQISGRARLIRWNYSTKEYRVDRTGFIFEIQDIID